MPLPLPIDPLLPEIAAAIAASPITVVRAPPGSGKSTRLPAYLLEHRSAADGQILLLQPRRIAAVSVAARIASEVGSPLGGAIGYAVRFESRAGRDTRLLVATEGILRRRLNSDITLGGIGAVIFDEFHERSLDGDLLLAIVRRLQESLRPDLRIVLMSATLAAEDLNAKLGDVRVVQTEGTMHPVQVKYLPMNPRDRLPEATAAAVAAAVERHGGDCLAFLPGRGEIYQTRAALQRIGVGADVDVHTLYSGMTLQEQQAAVQPSQRPRIILATNIAETSLTIEGVRSVVDSGLAKVLRYSPATGLDSLKLEPACVAALQQRAGRAGRTAPGVAYRLCSEAAASARPYALQPEIERVDFSAALLQLYVWGEPDVASLPWVDPPRPEAVAAAAELLRRLQLVDDAGITALGRRVGQLPLHPRLGRLICEGESLGVGKLACWAAALLSERDPFLPAKNQSTTIRREGGGATAGVRRWDCDIVERIEAIFAYRDRGVPVSAFGEIHRQGYEQIRKIAGQIAADGDVSADGEIADDHRSDDAVAGKPNNAATITEAESSALRHAFLEAFPDRVALRRRPTDPRGVMVGRTGVKLAAESGVSRSDLFLCLDVDAAGTDALVRRATAIEREWLNGPNLRRGDELFFSPTANAVQARRRLYWLDLLLEESPAAIEDRTAAAAVLAGAAASMWPRCLPADRQSIESLLGRIALLRRYLPDLEFPAVDEAALRPLLERMCAGKTSIAELQRADWCSQILSMLDGQQQAALARETPTKFRSPQGPEVAIDYSADSPSASLRIQEAYGLQENPRICGGRVPIQLHLLAPNGRPQQITTDLASFWRSGYPTVKKELKRRYSKHAWPDDPTVVPPAKERSR